MIPTLNVESISANKISNNVNCVFVFTCNIDLQEFQCRATTGDYGIGIGDLIYSSNDIKAGEQIEVSISASQLTFGDGVYRISLWGKANDIPFNFENVNFSNTNFNGDLGEWNS